MQVVPRIRTPISLEETKAILERLFPEEQVPLIGALVFIETARGQSMQNHNFGNITASEQFSGQAWRPTWFEVDEASSERDKRLHEEMLEGRAPRAFRAYDSPQKGADDFARILRSNFPEILEAASFGEPDNFRVALSKKYSKDYENPAATKTLAQFQEEFGGRPKGQGPVGPSSLHSAPLPTLRYGAAGDAVRALARLMGGPDKALFDADLDRRVRAWQAERGLMPDGTVGPKTWGELLS